MLSFVSQGPVTGGWRLAAGGGRIAAGGRGNSNTLEVRKVAPKIAAMPFAKGRGRTGRHRTWAVVAATLMVLPGCVERLLQIRSDPPGAEVTVNGEPAGVTPLDHRFTFYGTFEVTLRARGHRSLHRLEPVRPPWYEFFPLDFFAENLTPFRITDAHLLEYRLEEVPLSEAEMEREQQAAVERMQALERQLERPAPGGAFPPGPPRGGSPPP